VRLTLIGASVTVFAVFSMTLLSSVCYPESDARFR
jgi:hypothetical protein